MTCWVARRKPHRRLRLYLPEVEFHESRSLEEASALLGKFGTSARLLAGGTELLVDLKSGRRSAKHLISLQSVATLRGIHFLPGGLRIGALTTLSELNRHTDVCRVFPAIHDATSQMAAVQIRNMATVGGNVVCAVPCADLPPVLLVLKASATAWSPSGERTIRLESFFTGVRRTVLNPDEILTHVEVPAPGHQFGAAYARFSLREGNSVAVAAIAASVQLDSDGSIADAHIAFGAVSPTPRLAVGTREALIGRAASAQALAQASDAAMAECEPISDVRGSSEFRREIVGVLTRRALRTALKRAEAANHDR